LAARSYLEPFFSEISWEQNTETGVWQGDFTQVVDDLFDYAESHSGTDLEILSDFSQAVRGVNVYDSINTDLLRAAVAQFIDSADLSGY
jgi:hypothetical protein